MTAQRVKDSAIGLVVPLSLVLLWELLTRRELVPVQVLVPPGQVLATFLDMARSGELSSGLTISLLRVGSGFLAGATGGFLFGSAMGLSKTVAGYAGPLFNAVRQVPLLGWLPLLILCFGIGELYKVSFIAIGAFYPMALKTFEGIRGVPHSYVEVVRVLEFSRLQLLGKVLLPAALPSIIHGLRLSLGMAWMSVIGAELVAASEGIGYLMIMGRQLFQMDVVMVGVIVIGMIGFVLNQGFVLLERRFLSWRTTYNQ